MNSFDLTALIAFGSLLAGFVGALTGLGGGIVITRSSPVRSADLTALAILT